MRKSNQRIIRLNEPLGFQPRLIEPGYYHDPSEDALVMELRIAR
jgi:ribosomal protein S18 acetylase RimI-like enzyme